MERKILLQYFQDNILSPVVEYPLPPAEHLRVDRWVASSALQKAVRRGETQIALNAGLTYLTLNAASFWRRIPIIALEDIGVGGDRVVMDVLIGAAYALRPLVHASPWPLASFLIERMCDAPKDRSAVAPLQAVLSHPDLAGICKSYSTLHVADLLRVVKAERTPLPQKAVAAWYAAGTTQLKGERLLPRRGDLSALFRQFEDMGIPAQLSVVLQDAARNSSFPLSAVLPLVWLEARRSPTARIVRNDLGPTRTVEGIPLYAIDKHTAMGSRALAKFSRQTPAVNRFLGDRGEISRPLGAVGLAVFHAEGGRLRDQLVWQRTEELAALEREADAATVKLEPAALLELMQIVRDHLDELNDIREAEVLRAMARSRPSGAPSP